MAAPTWAVGSPSRAEDNLREIDIQLTLIDCAIYIFKLRLRNLAFVRQTFVSVVSLPVVQRALDLSR
jgi:hypothetical protein